MITLQLAFAPHNPGHGSMQWKFLHASTLVQSAFTVHSLSHAEYGSPKKLGRHEHLAAPLTLVQSAL